MKQVLVDIKKCLGCRSCELACAVQHSASRNLYQAIQESPPPRRRIFVESVGEKSFPLNCRHCDDAPCAAVCTTGAMKKDPATGVVANNPEKCVGCWMCVMACPFGAITSDG
ncbi:MAG: 4Fe-4S dicluster domain-containing protein, partial [Thermacetogeniaceae bacterium]